MMFKDVSIDKWIKKEQNKHPKCQCGCGQEITIKRFHHHHGIPKFIPGHHNVKNNYVNIDKWVKMEQDKHPKCLCGCDKEIIIKKYDHYHGIPQYINGHYNNKEIDKWVGKWVGENQGKYTCQCGCGQEIIIKKQYYKIGIPQYINGHYPPNGENHPMYGRTGENHPRWKGGISFEPYCYKFNNVLKEKIRIRDNRTCQLCGKKENSKKLSVHHIHYDKTNCFPDLITLCQSCNSKVNGIRDYWELYFMRQLFFRRIPITIYNLESELDIWNFGDF